MKEDSTEAGVLTRKQQHRAFNSAAPQHRADSLDRNRSQDAPSQETTGTTSATSHSALDDVHDFACFDQEIHDTVSSHNNQVHLEVNYQDLPEAALDKCLSAVKVVSHDTEARQLILRFSSLIAMRQFQHSVSNLSGVSTSRLCTEASDAELVAGCQAEMVEDEKSDPTLTLNLLRQTNEVELRCGSAKLNERRSFYFSSEVFPDLARNSPSPQSSQLGGLVPSMGSVAPLQQMVGVGLSLEAAPFSLSLDVTGVCAKDYRSEKKNSSFRLDLQSIVQGQDLRTTVMIKNIPNKYTQKMLLERIDAKHSGRYDFFYLPIDLKNNCNVGYAFINMSDPLFVVTLHSDLQGQTWERFNSEKICELTYGRIQGKPALVDNFQSAVDLRKVKPAVFASRAATPSERTQIKVSYSQMQK